MMSVGASLLGVHELRHRLVHDADGIAHFAKCLHELLRERAELSEHDGIRDGRDLDRLARDGVRARGLSRGLGRLLGFETYPRRPGGMRPLAGIACRPSVRRTMPAASIPCATARRARASVKAPLWMLKTTKYVTRLGLSRYVARKRGSWRRASASVGRRSEARENRPARNSERISSGGTPNRKTTPSFFG